MPTEPQPMTLTAIFRQFLRFGLLAWGGPVKRELVEEQKWLTVGRFNRLLAIYQVLPGPEAHELCVHMGVMKRGTLGGVVAGLGFMLPGLLLILALAALYRSLDLDHPVVAALFLGVQIGVIALIVRAVHRIADHTLSAKTLWIIAGLAAICGWFDVSFWITLPAAGLGYAALASGRYPLAAGIAAAAVLLAFATGSFELLGPRATDGPVMLAGLDSVGALALFLSGLKAGLLTFGGAYTAIPFVRDDAVGRGWVSDSQFLDGLALSGIIPAPLIIFATFVGYLAGGLSGALAITAGIFLPAFAFGILFYDRLERVMDDQRLHRFLEGVAAGVVGLIATTTIQLGLNVGESVPSLLLAALIFVAALVVLYLWRSKLSVPAVVLVSAAAGLLLFLPR